VTVISDQAPPGPDYLLRKIADLERQVRELASARRLEAATIGAGGLTIAGGAIRILDDTGTLVVQAGLLPDGTYGLAAVNPAGALVALSTLAFGIQAATVPEIEMTESQTFTDLTTPGPALPDVPIGTAGRCLVVLSSLFQEFAIDIVRGGHMSVEISGATDRAPSSLTGLRIGHTNDGVVSGSASSNNMLARMSAVDLVEGLNPGLHTFTAKYRSLGSGVDDPVWFGPRSLVVIPF
jgi:hypothetical protein